ncbi:MAG TPA: BON domain-containing protein [Abditibacteriaceae bacterium]
MTKPTSARKRPFEGESFVTSVPIRALHIAPNAALTCTWRAARTDRLTSLCLLLALSGTTGFGLLVGDNRAYAALPPLPQAKSPQARPQASKAAVKPSAKTPKATIPLSARVTSAQTAQNWRSDLFHSSLRARANDGADNPLPTRAMFPLSLLAKAGFDKARLDKVGGAVAGVLAQLPAKSVEMARPGHLSLSRLSNEKLPAKPGPRSDIAIGSLPYVWKGGMPSRPTLLADAKEQIKNAQANSQLPALPEKSDGTPDFSKMGKVVNATALKLPPASRPLPPKLQAASVPADTKYISSLPRLAQAGAPGASGLPRPGASNQIEVTVSTFVVLIAPDDLQTVAIADPDIADVVVVNSRAVLVNGKAPGATSLVIVDKKIRQYHVQVVPASGDAPGDLATSVAAAINLPDVQVRAIRGSIVLDGLVANADEQKMAGDVAALFAPKVVNLTQIRPIVANEGAQVPLDTQIKNAIRTDGVEVRVLGRTVLLEGQVSAEAQRATAEAVAKALAKDLEVVNLIRLPQIVTPPPARLTVEQVRDTLRSAQPAPVPEVPGTVPAPPQPFTNITVREVADQIILEGTAVTPEEIAQAALVAARSGMNVINRVAIAKAPAALSEDVLAMNNLASSINRSIPGAQVTVSGSKTRLVLTGITPTTNAAVQAEQIARSYSPKVDNLINTPRPQQIDVDITVLEINKSDLKNLGLTFTSLLDSAASNPTGFVIGQGSRPTGPVAGGVISTPGTVSDLVGSRSFQFLSPFQVALRAEVTKGNARILSNPRTTVLSGRTATFKVGGEVPIPGVTTLSGSGNATTSIIFKPFGILMDVTPVSSDDGVITAQIRTEVSQPDFTIGVVPPGGGGIIPGFSQRQAQTEVTIEPGGTLALGGLIQNTLTQTRREVPLLSRIPVLGALFSSKRFQKNETELVVFVTPRLLETKLKDGQLAPARPFSTGETEWLPIPMGIPGIPSFNNNSGFATGATAGGGGAGGGQ